MDKRAALYQQFDPARPLEADSNLYVDWQRDLADALDRDDLKPRLANSISLSGDEPVTRLLTGHRGVGKTTELKRIKRILEGHQGAGFTIGRKYFVSLLAAEQWLDLEDVGPPDIIFHIVRQLVEDLGRAGFSFAPTKFAEFFKTFWDTIQQSEVELKSMKIPLEAAEFGLAFKQVSGARGELRKLLQGQLPTIYHLINEVILAEARQWLKQEKNCDDILVIVDELDRIPQKVINEQGLTNHLNIFLDHAATLRSLHCNILYTIPIELAYSQRRERLKSAYSTEILSLPVIPVKQRDGSDFQPGLQALCEIVRTRARQAEAEDFCGQATLERICRVSGGHVRNLFILLRSSLERSSGLPIEESVVDRTLRRQADDISLPLRAQHWSALEKVRETKAPVEDDPDLWNGLLRDLFVLEYEDGQGRWYDWNPLLAESPRARNGAS